MRYFFLVAAGLRRKPLRSVLTLLAIAIAYLLFGVMHGVVAQFDHALDKMSDARLRVMSRANVLESIPLAYRERIAAVQGTTVVAPVTIFFGYYQQPTNTISGGAVDIDGFLQVLPEIVVPGEQLEVLRRTRTGMIAGSDVATSHGWQIGDRIPIKSLLWMNQDTGQDWQFELVAIANGAPEDDKLFAQEIYFHFDYLDQARTAERGTVSQFVVGIEDPARAVEIALEIDALFANSSDETETLNEKEFVRGQLERIGNISAFVYSILGAVSFTLFFLTGTTMLQAVRERIPELGVLKSLGFSGATLFVLVTAEAMLLCLFGAALGLGLAGVVFPRLFAAFGLSAMPLSGDVYLLGMVLALLLAIVVSAWPARRAGRLSIVDAIRGR